MIKALRFLCVAALIGAVCTCASTAPAATPPPPASEAAAATPEPARLPFALPATLPAGLDVTALDATVHPCDDFYRFSCGGWIDKTEIPADRSAYSRGFVTINERNELLLRDLLERAAAGKLTSVSKPVATKLGHYWQTCMDEPALEKGLADMQKRLSAFNNITDGKQLTAALASLHVAGAGALFGSGSTQDLKDSSLVIAGINEGGISLPDRDYYVLTDERMTGIRKQYVEHLENMFVLLGEPRPAAKLDAARVMELETRLAKVTMTNVERRDPQKLYHRLERNGVQQTAPSLDWSGYFKARGITTTQINVTHIPFLVEVEKMVKEVKPEQWRAYLSWHLLQTVVPAMPKAIQEESFRFQSAALTGQKSDKPRWKKCVSHTDDQLGELLGQAFVLEHFAGGSKEKALAMVLAVESTFEANLATLTWMDDATKAVARLKVQKMRNMIGYPDKFRSYDDFTTSAKSFLDNVSNGNREQIRFDVAKIGKPVDKGEWFMTPPTVNAYNDPQNNQIVFPAGILQPPFFNAAATDAVNFGAMGMVVGHEITHGFDDEGRQFDEAGNLRDWWSAASATTFGEKTACVKEQFDGYVAIDDIKLKGDLTLGENVADLGGLKLGLAALSTWEAKTPPVSAGLTSQQQFFMSYGQSWCSKYRPEEARRRAATDPHSPPQWRVNGPLGNLPAFAAAFGCKPTDAMVRAKRCDVW
jgi:putative endopeptidase